MENLILCIVGEWECRQNGQWELMITKNEVSRTVSIDGISRYKELIHRIGLVFGVDHSVVNIKVSYWSPHITDACTQTKLPPVVIDSDEGLMMFLKFSAANGGLNLFVSWCSSAQKRDFVVRELVNDEQDHFDDDELFRHLEQVEAEYKDKSRRCVDYDDEVMEIPLKRRDWNDNREVQGRGDPGSQCGSEETVPNHLFEDLASLIDEESSQPRKDNLMEVGESSSRRNVKHDKLPIEPIGFSLGVHCLDGNTDISDDERCDELIEDFPQVDNVYGNNRQSQNSDVMFCGSVFVDKATLRKALAVKAMEQTFSFKIEHSNKSRIIAVCVDSDCPWRVYATRHPGSKNFEIRTLSLTHTCSVDARSRFGEKATSRVLGDLLQAKYANGKKGPRACELIDIVLAELKVTISYMKAWRGKEFALEIARGNEEASYRFLPTYLHLLKLTNHGSITDLVTKEDKLGRAQFKYLFLSYGASVSGSTMLRRVVVIDGTQLKGKYKGCLLGASAQDGNMHIYPLAFGVVDSENEDSWTWFLLNLLKVVPDSGDIVFVSDRAKSIYPSIKKVYPAAKHASCTVHLYRNVRARFKSDSLAGIVSRAARAYTVGEFRHWWAEIECRSPACAKYLMEAGLEHWTLVYCPGNRYNVMSSNIAESLNAVMAKAVDYPIVPMLEYLRITLMRWFAERREKAIAATSACTPVVENLLVENLSKSVSFSAKAASFWVYQVNDDTGGVFTVDLKSKTCTCKAFDVLRFPCSHALAARKVKGIDIYSLVEASYSTLTWRDVYASVIMPLPRAEDIDVPDCLTVYPPRARRPPGRPKNKRIPSVGEGYFGGSKKTSTCGRCSGTGHNRKTCKNPI